MAAGATEYIVSPAPGDEFGVSVAGEDVQILEDTVIPYWQFLLWLAAMNILSVIDTLLYPGRIIFVILGFKITERVNILDNPNRNCIYAYIITKPGAYFSEIVKNTGLNRGTALYHISILETQNKIETYEDGGKIRYFQNNSMYSEKEKKILVTFQNITNQRIISEILNGKSNTNLTLAREIGVSKGTISWYVKNLKEIGLIKETNRGRGVIYKINTSYKNLIEKYK
ncbi:MULTISPECIES: winged helix-turn-helix transcriptional regulator [Methanosarcina]|nr:MULTISPECIES: winged helix-turn-helix transcriptional regulator [Methanosarcina]